MKGALFRPIIVTTDQAIVRFQRSGDSAWTTVSFADCASASAPAWASMMATRLSAYGFAVSACLDAGLVMRVSVSAATAFSLDIPDNSLMARLGFANGSLSGATIYFNMVVPECSLYIDVSQADIERFPYAVARASSLDGSQVAFAAFGAQERLRLSFGALGTAQASALTTWISSSLRNVEPISFYAANGPDERSSCLSAPRFRFSPILDGALSPVRQGSSTPPYYTLTISAEVAA